MASFESQGVHNYPNLFAGDFPRVPSKEKVVSGEGALTAGTVMGKITATGKLAVVDDAAVDGSETAFAVLAHDVDASAADAEALVYLSGHFNESVLTFGGDDTADTHRSTLRGVGIYLSKNVGA